MREVQEAPESLFWYWVNERHAITVKKNAKQSKPWTKDPILQQYKFTNVFRQMDTGTVWLTENFIKPHWGDELELIVFNICWYRMFNWKGTGMKVGWLRRWKPEVFRQVLDIMRSNGEQIFTGAHIIHSEPGEAKTDSITDVCTALWNLRYEIVGRAKATKSLQETFKVLTQVRHVGGFMAYEMVSDMRWTRLLQNAEDILTWANTGPGCLRGLRRLHPGITKSQGNDAMRTLLLKSYNNIGSHVPPLEMRDIEHSLCEFDKYCRVKFGEGAPRSKYPGGA